MESQPQYQGYAETAAVYRMREKVYQIGLNDLDAHERAVAKASQ